MIDKWGFNMDNFYATVYDAGIMPILLVDEADCAQRVVSAIERTAIPAVEILQRGELALEAFKEAVKLKKNAYVGAGTVCTLEHCKQMVDLGADFIVSPGYNGELVDWCVKKNVPVIPGVSNPTEVMLAVNAGVKMAKIFPFFELGGEKYVSAIAGPFKDIKFVITGMTDDRQFPCLGNPKIAAVGGVWMFQTEENHAIIGEDEIVSRLNRSLDLSKHYRNRW